MEPRFRASYDLDEGTALVYEFTTEQSAAQVAQAVSAILALRCLGIQQGQKPGYFTPPPYAEPRMQFICASVAELRQCQAMRK